MLDVCGQDRDRAVQRSTRQRLDEEHDARQMIARKLRHQLRVARETSPYQNLVAGPQSNHLAAQDHM